ncbi:hypothetical protein ACLOJK_026398 [Asimina triloba]
MRRQMKNSDCPSVQMMRRQARIRRDYQRFCREKQRVRKNWKVEGIIVIPRAAVLVPVECYVLRNQGQLRHFDSKAAQWHSRNIRLLIAFSRDPALLFFSLLARPSLSLHYCIAIAQYSIHSTASRANSISLFLSRQLVALPLSPSVISTNTFRSLAAVSTGISLFSSSSSFLRDMEEQLQNPDNGGKTELENPSNGDTPSPQNFHDEIDSSCSTPYVSAPSSPGRIPTGYYFSAPASPMHFALASVDLDGESSPASMSTSEFEFSARFPSSSSSTAGSMISADELFLNGQIRPMKLSSHLQRPQVLAPLLDLYIEEEEEEKEANTRGREMNVKFRNRSVHRRARSLSPMRNSPQFEWHVEEDQQNGGRDAKDLDFKDQELLQKQEASLSSSSETTPSVSASSSRSSSSGRSSKRWVFLKDFLYRSKSEGRGNPKEKFWHSISFAPSKEKKPPSSSSASASPFPASFLFHSSKEKKCCQIPAPAEAKKERKAGQIQAKKPTNGVGKRRVPPSPHELHYTANRAQAEEMRKKTFLPYRQGLLGCLGFSSKGFGYGAMNGLAKTLNTVSSR